MIGDTLTSAGKLEIRAATAYHQTMPNISWIIWNHAKPWHFHGRTPGWHYTLLFFTHEAAIQDTEGLASQLDHGVLHHLCCWAALRFPRSIDTAWYEGVKWWLIKLLGEKDTHSFTPITLVLTSSYFQVWQVEQWGAWMAWSMVPLLSCQALSLSCQAILIRFLSIGSG